MSTDFDKFAILDSFLDEVASYLPEIEANLDRLQQNPRNSEAIEETYRRAHTIGGSAAMMDFSGLSHVAMGMEEILGDALDGTAPLDAPSVALLRRSTGRLQRLLERARTDGEGAQIVAEDDTDRAGWRGRASSGAMPAANPGAPRAAHSAPGGDGARLDPARSVPGAGGEPMTSPQLPDWLAAFGGAEPAGANGVAPSAGPGSAPNSGPVPGGAAANGWHASNPAWHEAPTAGPIPAGAPSRPGGAEPSFEDMIQAFRNDGSEVTGPTTAMPMGPGASPATRPRADVAVERTAPFPAIGSAPGQGSMQVSRPSGFGGSAGGGAAGSGGSGQLDSARSLMAISPAWEELHVTEDAVRRQVGALRDVVATLREAAQAMEDERTELRSFLDGSKDALDRLEEWAGQAMGLDLRQSPEHVRRYLPLSVIWVTTTRLKKLVALLNNTGRRVTASQEDINEALGEMHTALDNVGRLFSSVAAVASAAGGTAPDGSFQATLTQVTQVAFAAPAARGGRRCHGWAGCGARGHLRGPAARRARRAGAQRARGAAPRAGRRSARRGRGGDAP
jgi:HPt (histidine-containing phosphotransfer) domain-containing protein